MNIIDEIRAGFAKLEGFTKSASATDTRVKELEAQLSTASAEATQAKADLGTVKASLASVSTELETVKASLVTSQAEVTQLKAAAQTAGAKAAEIAAAQGIETDKLPKPSAQADAGNLIAQLEAITDPTAKAKFIAANRAALMQLARQK